MEHIVEELREIVGDAAHVYSDHFECGVFMCAAQQCSGDIRCISIVNNEISNAGTFTICYAFKKSKSEVRTSSILDMLRHFFAPCKISVSLSNDELKIDIWVSEIAACHNMRLAYEKAASIYNAFLAAAT